MYTSIHYQDNTSAPVSVTSTVYSHWAERPPSSVYTVQSSASSMKTFLQMDPHGIPRQPRDRRILPPRCTRACEPAGKRPRRYPPGVPRASPLPDPASGILWLWPPDFWLFYPPGRFQTYGKHLRNNCSKSLMHQYSRYPRNAAPPLP